MPNSRIRCASLALALVLSHALGFRSATLADTGEGAGTQVALAEDYAEQAFAAYSAKDYAKAVALYRKAYDAAPSADILYNIARIYDVGLRDRPLAMTYYRRYVADPGASAERIQSANERLMKLRDAEQAALETSTLSASGAGEARAAPRAAAPAPEPVDEAPRARMSTMRVLGLVAGGVGLAGLGLGVGFGLSAKSDADRAEQDCDGNICSSQAAVDAADAGPKKANVATVGFAAGGALLATGVVLWLVGGKRDAERAETSARFGWSPLAGRSLLGAEISGKW